jgi:iron-sulfur cluster repair protein YtfE (RIC family)
MRAQSHGRVTRERDSVARRHDALIPLSHDHRAALALAFRLHNPAPPGPVTPTTPASTPESRRAETLAFFERGLRPHFAIEEEDLFPAIRTAYAADEGPHRLVDELAAEHVALARARDAVEAAGTGEPLDSALTAFADLLEAHVRREERLLFAAFPGRLAPDAVDALQRSIHHRRPPDGGR